MIEQKQIDAFLEHRRIAMVGVSRKKHDFSRILFRAFRKHGYDMVPVNPKADEIEGIAAFDKLGRVEPPAEAALLMTSRKDCEALLAECAEAGVKHVWLYGFNGPSSGTKAAEAFCEQHGIQLIPGYCPMMFLPKPGPLHGSHRLFLRLVGKNPA